MEGKVDVPPTPVPANEMNTKDSPNNSSVNQMSGTETLSQQTTTTKSPVIDSSDSFESGKESENCDIPGQHDDQQEEEKNKEEVDKSKKVRNDSGSHSTATTPSIEQDSGVSLISPDDSSWDTSANCATSKTIANSGEQVIERNDLPVKELVDDVTVPSPSGVKCSQEISSPAVSSSDSTAEVSENAEDNATPVAGAAVESGEQIRDQESVYYIKWIMFNQNKVPIVTQNENGPCPLLAIMNVLMLNGKVKLAPMMEMVTSEQLMTYLGDCILESRPQNLSEMTQANYEQNMQDAMGIMYKLQTGLDVNVKFAGVGDFEYTPECIIFDLLEIGLYHGWLVDPQDVATVEAVVPCSYNQLVERIISLKSSQKEDEQRKGLIAEQFLDGTASQLSYHGLCELSSVVKEKELCVFFRNNHFNTLYKHNNELFLLVTDQGYMTESGVVWETLSNVEGDGHFVDAQFRTYTKPLPSTVPIPDPGVPVGSPEQIDHDYQVALSLQEEDVQQAAPPDWPVDQDARVLADHELALRLQEQEHQSALSQQQQPPPQQPQQHYQHRPPAGPATSPQGQGRQAASHGASGSQQEGQRRRGEEPKDKESKCSIL